MGSARFYQKIQQTKKVLEIPRKSKGFVSLYVQVNSTAWIFLEFLHGLLDFQVKPCWYWLLKYFSNSYISSLQLGETFNLDFHEYS